MRRFYSFTVVVGLTLGLTAPLTAVFAVQLGASPTAASISVASLTAVVLLMDIFGTRYLPYLEPRRAITLGMSLWAVGSLASAVAPTFEVMLAARLVQGVGLAFHAGTAVQLAVRLVGVGRLGTGLARFQGAMTAGAAIAPLTGGAIADLGTGTTGVRIAFAVCGLLAGACALAAWLILPTVRSSTRPRWGWPRLPGMLRPRPLLALVVASAGQGLRGALALVVIPLVAADQMGLSSTSLGVFLTVMYLVEVCTMAYGGGLSDRHGRRGVVCAGAVAGMLGALLVVWAVGADQPQLFFAAILPLGIAGGCMLGVSPAVLVDLAGTAEVGLSAQRISRDLGFTGYTVLVGAVVAASGASGALWFCAGLYAALVLLVVVVGETAGRVVVLETAPRDRVS